MMPGIQTHSSGRLTWNPDAPALFESGWSICLKVLAHNYLDTKELVKLIKKEEFNDIHNLPLLLSYSEWIDFDRFARLLDVPPNRLKLGFLDQLGIRRKFSNRPYLVRHCPQCFEQGFHCTLFDMSIVAECPWHRLPLTSGCTNCGSQNTLNGRTVNLYQGMRCCLNCGSNLSPFLDYRTLNRLSKNHQATIAGYCSEFVEWWDAMRHNTMHFPMVADFLKSPEKIKKSSPERPGVLMGYARQAAGKAVYWNFNVEPCSAKYSEFGAISCSSKESQSKVYLNDDIGVIYRSVRRKIYNNYVKRHRKCLAKLLALTYDEAYCLCANKVCMVALTYLVWRMSIEGVSNIEGMRSLNKARAKVPLRLVTPELLWHVSILSKYKAQCCYFGFFGLFRKLSLALVEHERCIINLSEMPDWNGAVDWAYEELLKQESRGLFTDLPASYMRIKTVFPDMPLLNASHDRAKCDINFDMELIDSNSFDNLCSWSWAFDKSVRRRVLFRFTYSESTPKSQFHYITV